MAGFGFPKSLQISGLSGDPIFFENSTVTDPGNVKLIMTVSVLTGVTINLQQLLASCSMSGKLVVKANGLPVLTGRTNPAEKNIFLSWFPGRPIVGPSTVTVEFTARPSSPIVDIEAFLMATQQT